MNNEVLTDLKQFIAATVSQQIMASEERLTHRIDHLGQRVDGLEQKVGSLEQKVDGLSDFVREALDTTNDATGEQLADHERRITTLEQAAV